LSGFDVVRVPQAARDHEALITRIVAAEKPAYVTYEIEFASSGGH
jgi:Holliday junction resolvase